MVCAPAVWSSAALLATIICGSCNPQLQLRVGGCCVRPLDSVVPSGHPRSLLDLALTFVVGVED